MPLGRCCLKGRRRGSFRVFLIADPIVHQEPRSLAYSRTASGRPKRANASGVWKAVMSEVRALESTANSPRGVEETKAHYAFVYGDFRGLHRIGLIACH